MKKIEALAEVLNQNETALIVTSIEQIKVFEDELENFVSELKDVTYGTFKNNKKAPYPISVFIQGRTIHFLTINQLDELMK